MTKLIQILPNAGEITPEAIINSARTIAARHLPPVSFEAKSYCAALSNLFLADPRARPFPELQALGFWLRPASIEKMAQHYLQVPAETFRAPAGIVFQIPPGNVATLFGY